MARTRQGQGETLSGSPIGQFTNFAQKPIQARRAPTTADTGYEIGQLWVDTSSGIIFALGMVAGGGAEWNIISNPSFVSVIFTSSPILQSSSTTGGVPTGGPIAVNLMSIEGGIIMEQSLVGTQTIIAPRMKPVGLSVALDQTTSEGVEYSFGADRENSPHAMKIGTTGASFFEVEFNIESLAGAAPFIIGWRKVQAYRQTISYSDFGSFGMNSDVVAGNISIISRKNGGPTAVTDTNDVWGGNGVSNILRASVSARGDILYTINGEGPSNTKALRFDTGDVIAPFMYFIQDDGNTSEVYLISMKVGLSI